MQTALQQSPEEATLVAPGSAAARRRALWMFSGCTLTFLGAAGLNPATETPLAVRLALVATGLLLGVAMVSAYAKYGARMAETRFTFTGGDRAVVTGARGNVLEDGPASRITIELCTLRARGRADQYFLVWQRGRVVLPLSEQEAAMLERLGARRGKRPLPRSPANTPGRKALWAFVVVCVLILPIVAVYQWLAQAPAP